MRPITLATLVMACTEETRTFQVPDYEAARVVPPEDCRDDPSMLCGLDTNIVSEGSLLTATCEPTPYSCISSVVYTAGDLGRGRLTKIDRGRLFQGTIDTDGASPGAHKVKLRGLRDGSIATSNTLVFMVAGSEDTGLYTGDTGNGGVTGDQPAEVHSFAATEDPVAKGSDVTLNAYITDDIGVGLVFVELNGKTQVMTEDSSDIFTATYGTIDYLLGEQTAYLTAYDTLGQITETTTTFIVDDLVPPTITDVTVNPDSIYSNIMLSQEAVVSATITDDIDVVSATATIDGIEETLTDDDDDSIYEATFTFTGDQFDSGGSYTVTVSASDEVNTTTTTAELTVLDGSVLATYIACYDFEKNLEDITGTYNATSSRSPAYTTGVTGYAVDMTGVNAVINTGIDINPTDGFTIAGWVYLNTGACSSTCNLWDTWHDEGTHELALFVGGSYYNGKLRFLIEPDGGGTDEQLDSMTDAVDLQGAWHHLVTTFSNTDDSQTIYIDGSADNSRAMTVDNHDATKQIWLGQYGSSGQWFSGLFDSVIMYETSLSGDEISFLYNSGKGRECF